ncbi:MAG: cell wall hydrolase [Lachnospiraceae bacterium]|nr:cell wall hydrolase [Lachnospiraceae bacterium]
MLFLAVYCSMLLSNTRQGDRVKSIYEIKLNQIVLADKERSTMEINMQSSSQQRVVTYRVLQRPKQDNLRWFTEEDYKNLLRIVEAEASGEDETGKLLVANVVLNRVKDEEFPNTITEVIFQKNKGVTQFSPVANGRFWKVEISEETVSAVNRALAGEDVSGGALYFAARKYAEVDNMRWFDEKLDYLFTHGEHEFFAE